MNKLIKNNFKKLIIKCLKDLKYKSEKKGNKSTLIMKSENIYLMVIFN